MGKKKFKNDEIREFLLELGSLVPIDYYWSPKLKRKFNQVMAFFSP